MIYVGGGRIPLLSLWLMLGSPNVMIMIMIMIMNSRARVLNNPAYSNNHYIQYNTLQLFTQAHIRRCVAV